MAGKRKLTNLEEVKSIVKEYKNNPKPTLVELCQALKIVPLTLYSYMDRDDEMAEVLIDGWQYLIGCHEKALWEKNPVSHMFYLKTIKRFGYRFNDQESVDLSPPTKVTIEVIDKK